MSDGVECFGEVQGHTDEWMHGQHGEDCVEENNESSVCSTRGSERELISKMSINVCSSRNLGQNGKTYWLR